MKHFVFVLAIASLGCEPVLVMDEDLGETEQPAPLDPCTFGACDEWPMVSGGRIRAMYYRGSDGSQFSDHYGSAYDTLLEAPAVLALTHDGTHRWMPLSGSSSYYFADAECTIRLWDNVFASYMYGLPDGRRYAAVCLHNCIDHIDELYEAGPVYTGPVWTRITSSCSAVPAGSGLEFRTFSVQIPLTSLVRATFTVDP
jgi:hypothetical protein